MSLRQSVSARVSVVILVMAAAHAQAVNLTVTTGADSGPGSLRQAILDANAALGHHRIDFSGDFTIVLASSLPSISKDITIMGNGWARTIVDGNHAVRPFFVASEGTLVLDGVMVQNGYSGSPASPGGAIWNAGRLVFRNSRCEHNRAYYGGCIAKSGKSTRIERSLIASNEKAGASSIFAAGVDGFDNEEFVIAESEIRDNHDVGIRYTTGATLYMSDSTVAGHTFGEGIGIIASDMVMTNSTVSGNFWGIVQGEGNSVSLRNATIANNFYGLAGSSFTPVAVSTILAGNVYNCSSTDVASRGYNLDDDGSCALDAPSDRVGVDARLDVLAENGGLTRTHALLSGSGAIDRGAELLPRDQRGVPRAIDGDGSGSAASDIGAYEWQAALKLDGFDHGDLTSWPTAQP